MRAYDYNLIVVGSGPAGLVAAEKAIALKAKVALIERGKMGGDRLHTGCIPSKALLRTSKFLAQARRAEAYGIKSAAVDMDFADVMERVRRVVEERAQLDHTDRFHSLGVACYSGSAAILSRREVVVKDRILRTRSILIATGARPMIPAIEGLSEMHPLTSDTVWNLRELPKRLLVLGGGVIGCELAQAFQRLGSEVTLVERNPRIMPKEDEDVSALVSERFQREGMQVVTGVQARAFRREAHKKILRCEPGGQEIEFDEVLVALGRRPNSDGLGLEKIGVKLRANGTIETNATGRSSVRGIFAAGDVAGPLQFAHFASMAGEGAAGAALLGPWGRRFDLSVFPWAIFTDPEVARVGLDETEANRLGIRYDVSRFDYKACDRALVEEEHEGFVKVLTVPGKDKILGATIVGAAAGELIHEWAFAMKGGRGIKAVLSFPHAYPTISEVNRGVALAWKKQFQAPIGAWKSFHELRRSLGI